MELGDDVKKAGLEDLRCCQGGRSVYLSLCFRSLGIDTTQHPRTCAMPQAVFRIANYSPVGASSHHSRKSWRSPFPWFAEPSRDMAVTNIWQDGCDFN